MIFKIIASILLSSIFASCDSKYEYQIIEKEKIAVVDAKLSFLFSYSEVDSSECSFLIYIPETNQVNFYDENLQIELIYKTRTPPSTDSKAFVLVGDTLVGILNNREVYFENIRDGGFRNTTLDELSGLILDNYQYSMFGNKSNIFVQNNNLFVPLFRGDINLMSLSGIKEAYNTSGMLIIDLSNKDSSRFLNVFPYNHLEGHYYSFSLLTSKLKDSYLIGFELSDTLYEYEDYSLLKKISTGKILDIGNPIDTSDLFDLSKLQTYLLSSERYSATIFNSKAEHYYRIFKKTAKKDSKGKFQRQKQFLIASYDKDWHQINLSEVNEELYNPAIFMSYKNGFVLLNIQDIKEKNDQVTLSYFEIVKNEN